jgi:hypothetical protein
VRSAPAPGTPERGKCVAAQYSDRLPASFGAPSSVNAALRNFDVLAPIMAGGQDAIIGRRSICRRRARRRTEDRQKGSAVKDLSGLAHMDMLNRLAAADATRAAFKG